MKKLQVRRLNKQIFSSHKPINSEMVIYQPEEIAKVLGDVLEENEYGKPAPIPEKIESIPSTATPTTLIDEEIADIVDEESVVPVKKEKLSKKREAKEETVENIDNKEIKKEE